MQAQEEKLKQLLLIKDRQIAESREEGEATIAQCLRQFRGGQLTSTRREQRTGSYQRAGSDELYIDGGSSDAVVVWSRADAFGGAETGSASL
ncbi:g556 [Coccomyxa elongata]